MMATCKECVHVEVCTNFANMILDASNVSEDDAQCLLKKCTGDATVCNDFADRSRFVELPCLPGDKVFYFDTDERIYVQTVESLIYGLTKTGFVINSEVDFISDLLGERFFLSYEEAKMALKEREKDEGKGAGVSVGSGEACDRGRAAE